MKDYLNPEQALTLKSFFSNVKNHKQRSFPQALSDQLVDDLPKSFYKKFVNVNDFYIDPKTGEKIATSMVVNPSTGKPVSDLKFGLSALGQNIKQHPWASAGLGIGAAANIAGLVDNDKIGGQLIGGAAGAAIPALLMKGGLMKSNPLLGLGISLGGGALGSLYDMLRAKKEEEQAAAQQYVQMQ